MFHPHFMLLTDLTSISFISFFKESFQEDSLDLVGVIKGSMKYVYIVFDILSHPYHSRQHLLMSCTTCPSCLLPKRAFFFCPIAFLDILLPLLCHLASPKTNQDAPRWGLHKIMLAHSKYSYKCSKSQGPRH
jgi:hypothetical protein